MGLIWEIMKGFIFFTGMILVFMGIIGDWIVEKPPPQFLHEEDEPNRKDIFHHVKFCSRGPPPLNREKT